MNDKSISNAEQIHFSSSIIQVKRS